MTQNTFYRLAEFKIIENENGNLWWETHSGLGSLKTGTCFIRGNILFIEFSNSEESGFLKGEFLDRLYQCPMWEKTDFFCTNYTIYNCNSGRKTTRAELMTIVLNRTYGAKPKGLGAWDKKLEDIGCPDADKGLSHRLGRYEIIEIDNGGIWWRKTTGFQVIFYLLANQRRRAQDILNVHLWPSTSNDPNGKKRLTIQINMTFLSARLSTGMAKKREKRHSLIDS